MKAIIKNWAQDSLDDKWFLENGKEKESDLEFFKGRTFYPIREIPFFFSVECSSSAFRLFVGQILGAAISGEIEIIEPETGLSLSSFLASPVDDEIEITPDWLIGADAIEIFADARNLYWPGTESADFRMANQAKAPDDEPVVKDENSTDSGRAHVSNSLAILNQAARQWWANANRDDPQTHPKNAHVVSWLMDHGYQSKTLAEKAATIIRPEWATTGRPQEK